jgi:hypothetical protein
VLLDVSSPASEAGLLLLRSNVMNASRLLAAVLILATAGFYVCSLAGQPEARKSETKAGRRVIPLSSMYTTIYQHEGGLKLLSDNPKNDHAKVVTAMISECGPGASNLFLVYAEDIKEAIAATKSVLFQRRSADKPASGADGEWKPRAIWLVAYLGVFSSEPPGWIVDPVVHEGNTVRVPYWAQEDVSGRNAHPHFLWVPLGKVEPGKYELQLYDARRKEVTLFRRVVVPAK